MPWSSMSLLTCLVSHFQASGLPKFKQSAVFAAENPFGMILGEPSAGGDSFRLEPDDDLHVLGVGMVADFAQTLWENAAYRLPRCPSSTSRPDRTDTSRRPSTSSRASCPLRDSDR